MEILEIIIFCCIWLAAGFLNGMTSFGALMFAIPLLTFLMDAKEAIVLGCVTSLAITTPIAYWYRKKLPIRKFFWASLSCTAGVPLGIAILQRASVSSILLCSSAILISFLIWQIAFSQFQNCQQFPFWGIIPAGFISGVVMGATGMSGPVLAMYALMRHWPKETSLVIINTMCLVATFFFIYIQWKNGMLTSIIFKASLISMPITALGVLLSFPVLKRIDNFIFRKLLIIMLLISALILIYRGLSSFI